MIFIIDVYEVLPELPDDITGNLTLTCSISPFGLKVELEANENSDQTLKFVAVPR